MDRFIDADQLRSHQQVALAVLKRGVIALEAGPEAMLGTAPEMRAKLAAILNAYQRFKHERIFDPAIASGDLQRAVLARHMKVACISAGEVFRTHMVQWPAERIAADWPEYKIAARLTGNQLCRHIKTEAGGIADLLAAYA